jgi:peptide/nickel transport system permease protein
VAVLDVLGMDFVRTAQAYGVPRRSIILRHVLRNGLIPLITAMTLDIPALFTGAIITEAVFSWPGIGRLYLDGLRWADWPLIQGLLIVNTAMIVVANLIADLSYVVVDPRVRYS